MPQPPKNPNLTIGDLAARTRANKVTPDDVQRIAQTYLVPENRVIGIYIPTGEEEPVGVDEDEPDEVE